MDSSYFLISNNTSSTNSTSDLDFQSSSSSSFNYDPFEGFSFLDQQGMRLYDYYGGANTTTGAGRTSPFINQCPLVDPLDQLHHQQSAKIFPFQTDPNQEDDDDLHETLTSFVGGDLDGVECDTGYNSGVDLFSTASTTNSIVDCSDSTEAYYLRLSLDHHQSNNNTNIINGYSNYSTFSDINNNYNSISYDCDSNSNNCSGDSNTSQSTAKRSVLMNLLIDGSDVGAGYTSHNCRALPKSRLPTTTTTTNFQQQQPPNVS